MIHSDLEKSSAMQLREEGHSFQEIADMTKIPKGTVRHWTHTLILSDKAKERLAKRKGFGGAKGRAVMNQKRKEIKDELYKRVMGELSKVDLNPTLQKLLCSMLFWAEGKKVTEVIGFTNSDPKMMSVFLRVLRAAFPIDEKKLRVLVHLHSYHNEDEVKAFWSEVTQIPLTQFTKSYIKQNTGKRKREGYMGTLSLRYYSARIAQELFATYNTLTLLLDRGIG